MCGIVSLLAIDGSPIDPTQLLRASDAIAHRGPDDEGFLLGGPAVTPRRFGGPASMLAGLDPVAAARPEAGYTVGLANRRLAIIDLTSAGHGPMPGAADAVWLTYNGEVYNYRELRDELQALGHTFQGHTDTEVVLEAYLEWGDRFVERLNGMFALAVWDGRSGTLLLARDRLGIKPLYVTRIGGVVAAASEPKALLAIGAARDIDWDMAYGYLTAGYADWAGRTFFRSIRQVEPGTVETFDRDGSRRVCRWWSLDDVSPFAGTPDEAAARFRELFLESVRLQLRSDVPVGSALSGGLDSSSIVGAVAAETAQGVGQHAFTAVFPGTSVDEARYASAVADRHGVQWHTVTPTADELVTDLDALVRAQDEPFPSSSSYAQYRVMRLARDRGVTVLLDGQGGDELLAGYTAFLPYAIADAVRGGRVAEALHELWLARASQPLRGVVARTAAALAPAGMATRARSRLRASHNGAVSSELHAAHAARLRDLEGLPSTLDDVLRRSISLTTLPVLLRSEDRNSMAHSREARVPFLDHRLVELAFALPRELKISRGTTKVVLRRALADLVPGEVLSRTDKIGFATPEADWLAAAGPLIGDTLARAGAAVDHAAASALWKRLQAGDRTAAAPLWRIVCFERWQAAVVA